MVGRSLTILGTRDLYAASVLIQFTPRGACPMLTQVMQDAINEQINHELFSSYSYLSMAAW